MSDPARSTEDRALQRLWSDHRNGRVPVAISSSVAPGPVGVLVTLGGLAGLVHGGLLAYMARNLDRRRAETLTTLLLAAVVAVVLSPLAWFVALHLALTLPFLDRGVFAVMGVGASWILGSAICLWAAWEGWTAFRRAFARWPERRVGSVILTAILAVLATLFVLERPALWGTDVQVKGVGAMILALGATVWIALPIVLAVLHGAHRILGDRFFPDPDSNVNSSAPGV